MKNLRSILFTRFCRWWFACPLALTAHLAVFGASAQTNQDRFVWVFGWGLESSRDTAAITNLLETAARSGLNGAVLSANLDTLCKQSPAYLSHLQAVKTTCDNLGLELIPSVFSVGYGGGILSHNRHLAEGLPVRDAAFVVHGNEARFEPDHPVTIVNGSFEEFKGNQFPGFGFHDSPGVISHVDTNTVHSGRAALRLEGFQTDRYGHGRIMQKVSVQPQRCYRMSLWVKTERLQPATAFRVTVLAGDRELAPRTFPVKATSDWQKLTLLVNSLEFDSMNVYAGVWEGKEGRVWLDDWFIEEVGPINALRRPGTPLTVRSEDRSTTYQEGQDYEVFASPEFSHYRLDQPNPPIRLRPGGPIHEGDRLRVSWFHPMLIHDSQVTVCMAENQLDEIFDHEARLLAEQLHPRKILLNMDEVRMGGTCEKCRDKNMAELLGGCIGRQVDALRRYSPEARIYIWSDMLDPNHNARGQYYLVRGDFTGSWNYVPKDLIVTVWGGAPREQSLRFFADHGFQTLVACYYDADDLKEVRGWQAFASKVPNVRGFMYTPWLKKYDLLPDFGKLLRVK